MTSQALDALDDKASDDAAVPQQPRTDEVEHQGSVPPARAEIGGREGLDPTRYGDWELRGRCIDF